MGSENLCDMCAQERTCGDDEVSYPIFDFFRTHVQFKGFIPMRVKILPDHSRFGHFPGLHQLYTRVCMSNVETLVSESH